MRSLVAVSSEEKAHVYAIAISRSLTPFDYELVYTSTTAPTRISVHKIQTVTSCQWCGFLQIAACALRSPVASNVFNSRKYRIEIPIAAIETTAFANEYQS